MGIPHDRYRDIALVLRDFEGDAVRIEPVFMREYGLVRPDREKIAFYQLLDEFF